MLLSHPRQHKWVLPTTTFLYILIFSFILPHHPDVALSSILTLTQSNFLIIMGVGRQMGSPLQGASRGKLRGQFFLQISFVRARNEFLFLFLFVIGVVFRSKKCWTSFDVCEWGLLMMMMMIRGLRLIITVFY